MILFGTWKFAENRRADVELDDGDSLSCLSAGRGARPLGAELSMILFGTWKFAENRRADVELDDGGSSRVCPQAGERGHWAQSCP
jgi:hypothetical protein